MLIFLELLHSDALNLHFDAKAHICEMLSSSAAVASERECKIC